MTTIFSTLAKTLIALSPKLLLLLLLLFSSEPMGIPGIQTFPPLFDVMFIYYWGIYSPRLFPAWFVFSTGILQDILYGMPLGVTAFSNLVLLSIVISQRKFLIKEPFWVQWFGFILFSFCACVVKWIMAMATVQAFYIPVSAITQWLISCGAYALVHWLCNKLHVTLAANRYA